MADLLNGLDTRLAVPKKQQKGDGEAPQSYICSCVVRIVFASNAGYSLLPLHRSFITSILCSHWAQPRLPCPRLKSLGSSSQKNALCGPLEEEEVGKIKALE